MKLGVVVGLGPGDFVLDGDPAPPKGGTARPRNFLLVYIVAGCKTKFSVKFVISALKNVYK